MNSIKYDSRFSAGKLLSEFIKRKNKTFYNQILINTKDFFSFAIPNGGVPVVEGFCSIFNMNYDVLIVRKLKIPYNTEAGFGAITTDGTVLFNQPLLNQLNLSKKQIDESIAITREEIEQRIIYYNRKSNLQEVYNKYIQNNNIFLLDDGLASGFTMLAGIKMIKKYNPKEIYIAVPTAPLRTIKRIEREVSDIFCPNIRNTLWFAVADAYRHWYDVPEREVMEILNKSNYYIKKA
jgi:predicted phosphoribosyltransferase